MKDGMDTPEGVREGETIGVTAEHLLHPEWSKPTVIKLLCFNVMSIQPDLLSNPELFRFSMVRIIESGYIWGRLLQSCMCFLEYPSRMTLSAQCRPDSNCQNWLWLLFLPTKLEFKRSEGKRLWYGCWEQTLYARGLVLCYNVYLFNTPDSIQE